MRAREQRICCFDAMIAPTFEKILLVFYDIFVAPHFKKDYAIANRKLMTHSMAARSNSKRKRILTLSDSKNNSPFFCEIVSHWMLFNFKEIVLTSKNQLFSSMQFQFGVFFFSVWLYSVSNSDSYNIIYCLRHHHIFFVCFSQID